MDGFLELPYSRYNLRDSIAKVVIGNVNFIAMPSSVIYSSFVSQT